MFHKNKMNKSKSYPTIHENEEFNLKKSTSFDIIKLDDLYFEEFFEGDGELGIIFKKSNNDKPIVKRIIPNTVASETYGLYQSMILIEVDDKDITDISFENIMIRIKKKWLKNNRIYLKFQKVFYHELYKILFENNIIKYYDKFVELGAKTKEDFKFVEYEDLIKMNMNKNDIISFKNINPDI